MTGLLVALAGGLGAAARFWVDAAVSQRNPTRFPLGTLLINVTGSLLLGLLVGWASGHAAGDLVAIAGTGFLGGYTTFSTFSAEIVTLLQQGRAAWAFAAAGAHLAGSVLATFAGGILVALQSVQGRTFWQFVQGSRIELRKVVWPTRRRHCRPRSWCSSRSSRWASSSGCWT